MFIFKQKLEKLEKEYNDLKSYLRKEISDDVPNIKNESPLISDIINMYILIYLEWLKKRKKLRKILI